MRCFRLGSVAVVVFITITITMIIIISITDLEAGVPLLLGLERSRQAEPLLVRRRDRDHRRKLVARHLSREGLAWRNQIYGHHHEEEPGHRGRHPQPGSTSSWTSRSSCSSQKQCFPPEVSSSRNRSLMKAKFKIVEDPISLLNFAVVHLLFCFMARYLETRCTMFRNSIQQEAVMLPVFWNTTFTVSFEIHPDIEYRPLSVFFLFRTSGNHSQASSTRLSIKASRTWTYCKNRKIYPFWYVRNSISNFFSSNLQGVPKNALSECCWSHSAMTQSQVADTPSVWKLIFWLFLTRTKPDQAFPSHFHDKIYPHSTQFRLWSCSISTFFGTHCIYCMFCISCYF